MYLPTEPKILVADGKRYRVFGQALSMTTYKDQKMCYADNAFTHVLQIPWRWIQDRLFTITRFEARLWNVPEGGPIPKYYTLSWWILQVHLLINRTSTHVNYY